MILPNPKGQMPKIDPSAFVIIGDVTIGPDANIWFGAVIRGDFGKITVGARTSIQENAVLHIEIGTNLEIGEDCVVGHGAMIHGAGKVGNKCLIGIGSIVLQGTTMRDGSIVAGGAVVRGDVKGKVMVAGVPAEVKKELGDEILRSNAENANTYVNNGRMYKKMLEEIRK